MEDAFEGENFFELQSTSYLTVGGIIRQTIKCLPCSKKFPAQPLIIGDTRGALYVTVYNQTEPEILVRTQPYPKEVSCIKVDPDYRNDTIFFTVGNSLYLTNREYTNKAKIEFNIADDINTFDVIGDHVWCISNDKMSHFKYGDTTTEIGTFFNDCKILSIHVYDVFNRNDPIVIIGTSDGKIKILKEEEQYMVFPTKGGVTCFCPLKMSNSDSDRKNILFGTDAGTFGVLVLETLEKINILYEKDDLKNQSEVIDMRCFDINSDGANEVILIRADGLVEIYQIGENMDEFSIICKHNTKEHLTGLDVGIYKEAGKPEIILSSLTGLVFGLTPLKKEKNLKKISLDKKDITRGIYQEERDVSCLRATLNKKQEEFAKGRVKPYDQTTKNVYKVEVKFDLIIKESVFNLIIDSEFPLEMVLIHCKYTKLCVLDVKTKDASLNIIDNNSMDEDTKSHTNFLATILFKEASHRLFLVLRTYEGPSDVMNITIIPNNKPKTAQILQVPIYSLSFHKKYEPQFDGGDQDIIDVDDENAVNKLVIQGMTADEINQILHLIIPNIPDILKKSSVVYKLKSNFLNTILEITINTFNAEIKCCHLSTLVILKEQIIKEAELRKKEAKFSIKFKSNSVFKILEALNPKIDEIFQLENKFKITKAFKELGNSYNISDLPDDYARIVNKSEEINDKYGNRTLNLRYYIDILANLLKDIRKVINIPDFDTKLEEIESLFDNYSYDKVKSIFDFLNY